MFLFFVQIKYQLLMAQSILALYSENVWSKQHTRQTHKTLHWILQGLGSSAAIAGMIIEFINRWKSSKNHFTSTHSILGLAAFILTLLGMFNGISALWSCKLRTFVQPVYLKLAHNLTGIAAFVLGNQIRSINQFIEWFYFRLTTIPNQVISAQMLRSKYFFRNFCALLWPWQGIYASKFTRGHSNVAASFGNHYNPFVVDRCDTLDSQALSFHLLQMISAHHLSIVQIIYWKIHMQSHITCKIPKTSNADRNFIEVFSLKSIDICIDSG